MRFSRTISLTLLVAFPLQASELPDLGEASRAVFSEAQEIQLGREIMRQIRVSRDYLEDAEIADYLNSLGDRLGSSSADPYRHFEFFAVKDPTINAFALPGGYIGVHTGLISAARNESELAGVLAHEIAHVTQNHIARMVDAQKTSGLVSLAALALAILAARSNSQVSQAAVTMAGAMNAQAQLDFSRDNEREADRVGLQTLTRAGYSPAGMVSFFERLQAQGRIYENNAPSYLRTHPLTHQRIADMQDRVAELPYRQHVDSLEFRLVRARVWSEEGDAAAAVKRFETITQSDEDDPAGWYGLARAALRSGRPDVARRAQRRLEDLHADSPMVESLAADVLKASGRQEQAIERLGRALQRYPSDRALAYVYARTLLEARQPRTALKFLDERLHTWPEDAAAYLLKSEAHSALGERLDAHLAQAEAYALQGATGAAIEQLQLALRTGERDFHKLSIVEARMRELREREQRETARK